MDEIKFKQGVNLRNRIDNLQRFYRILENADNHKAADLNVEVKNMAHCDFGTMPREVIELLIPLVAARIEVLQDNFEVL